MKSRWLNVITKISESKETQCPECGSAVVKAAFRPINGKNGFIVAWCEQCRHAATVSHAKDDGTLPKINATPQDLVYS